MTTDPNTSPQNTAEAELDSDALSAIRSILTEDVTPTPRASKFADEPEGTAYTTGSLKRARRKADALPRLKQPIHDPEAQARAEQALARPTSRRRFSLGGTLGGKLGGLLKREPKEQLYPPEPAPQPRKRADVESPSPRARVDALHAEAPQAEGLMDRLRGYRPTPAHIVLGLFALLVLMRPWLVLGLFFLFCFVMVGVFLIAGYDGFWQSVIKVSRWYAKRRPSRAEIIHARLDRFAVRWDSFLDRFPEGSVDGLYLPDFGELEAAERRHDEAMERRLSGMHEKGA